MLHLRANPLGIDSEIQSIQTDLYNALIDTWINKLQGYGRIYKDADGDSDTPKPFWFEDGIDYTEVYFDDKFAGTFFFIDDDNHNTEDSFNFSAEVKCVFMLNLREIFSEEQDDRADAKAQRDAIHTLRELSHGKFEITGIQKGLQNVLSGLDVSQVGFEDMHPKHCFSVNFTLNYYFDNECDIL